MDALVRTELWFGHGCSGDRTHQKMNEVWFGHGCSGACMLLELERNYGLGRACTLQRSDSAASSAHASVPSAKDSGEAGVARSSGADCSRPEPCRRRPHMRDDRTGSSSSPQARGCIHAGGFTPCTYTNLVRPRIKLPEQSHLLKTIPRRPQGKTPRHQRPNTPPQNSSTKSPSVSTLIQVPKTKTPRPLPKTAQRIQLSEYS